MQSSSRGVKRTLKGHAGQVTTVKSLEGGIGSHQLVSGDSVGEVRLWTTDSDQVGLTIYLGLKLTVQYSSTSIQAHKGSISALGAPTASGPLAGHILTGGSDGLIKLWDLSTGKPEVKQTIDLKGKLPLDLQVASLPGSSGTLYRMSGWSELTL
jgi:elongator complex protein 2